MAKARLLEMVKSQLDGKSTPVSYEDLSNVLDRSEALIRMIAKALDIDVTGQHVPLHAALDLMRFFAGGKGEQDHLLSKQNSKLQAVKAREFEYAMALEIANRERSSLQKQVEVLTVELERAHHRGNRLEQKLHDLTASFAHLVSQRDRLVAQTKINSKTSIKQHQGRSVLYLEQPVNLHLLF